MSPRYTLRAAGAVLAGFGLTVALSIGTDIALMAAGVLPPLGQPSQLTTTLLIVSTLYRLSYSVAGCYLAARLAPAHPLLHAMALGVIGMLLSTVGAITMWGATAHWYPLLLIAMSLPSAWVGGRLFEARAAS